MYVLRVPVNEWVNVCLCVCICLAIGLVFGAPSFNLSRILFYTHFQKEKKSKEWHLTGTEQSDRQTQKKRVSRSEKEKDVVKRQYCSKPVTAQMTDKQTKVAIFARHTLFCSALVVRRRKERHLFFFFFPRPSPWEAFSTAAANTTSSAAVPRERTHAMLHCSVLCQ